jgi:predicted PurR-regulated permease PerM
VLVGVGLYILANYLRALAWALVLAIAIWPSYDRVRRQASPLVAKEVLPVLFTALVGLAVFLPFATLAVEALREVREIVDYGRMVEESGIPVPDFVIQLPYVGQWVADWWREHLSHAGWAKEIVQQMNTSSIRELGANLGESAVHRVVLFGISLLTLFFLFRHGESISMQCRTASQKLFGERGERVALQMVASVHGTVAGLILVAIGEGILLGVVYFLTKLPHPILFGVATAIAAMIPFAAVLAVGLAALVLLGSGGVGPALIVVLAGFAVIFVADHFVRPKLIGGATKLPFLWVLLGILGGVESVQLLGLFLGPAIMAALMLLWRQLTTFPADQRDALVISEQTGL